MQTMVERYKPADARGQRIAALAALGSMLGLGAVRPGIAAPQAEPGIMTPSLGRPAFVAPGAVFQVIATLGGEGERVDAPSYFLISETLPVMRIALTASAAPVGATGASTVFANLTVPADVPPRTYDLEMVSGDRTIRARHCVAVGAVRDTLRLVHLSDMNTGDLSAPHFDQRLIDEINLIGPDVLVLTGDLVDLTHPDPQRGWREAVEWLTRFDAPAIIARGAHDDAACYGLHVAPSEVGEVRVGWLRALVLADTPPAPLQASSEQVTWIEKALAQPGDTRLTLIASNAAQPGLLAHWRARGQLGQVIPKARIGLWLSGGHTDWDGREQAALVHAAAPMQYVRTHQASPATIAGAGGVSHYRIIDVSPTRAIFPGVGPTAAGDLDGVSPLPPSLSAGRVECWTSSSAGPAPRVVLHAVSRLPARMNGLRQRVLLDKRGGQRPWCRGGRLLHMHEHDRWWECLVEFDVPELGAARLAIGCDTPPDEPRLDVRFETDDVLEFERRETESGIVYAALHSGQARVHLRNAGGKWAELAPTVRFAGQRLSYRVAGSSEPAAGVLRLGLPPGALVTLEMDLAAVRETVGVHELQLYVPLEGWTVTFAHALEARLARGGAP